MDVKICIGEYCHIKEAEMVVKTFQDLLETQSLQEKINLKGCFCMRKCKEDGVSVQVDQTIHKVKYEDAEDFFKKVIQPSVEQ